MKKKDEKKHKSILISDKLIFKRRKIKTVGDLVKRNIINEFEKNKEKNTEEESDDLSEEFFKKYFAKYNEYLSNKEKEEKKKTELKIKDIEKETKEKEENISMESFRRTNKEKENSINNNINNSKDSEIKKNKNKNKQNIDVLSEEEEENNIFNSMTSPLLNFNLEVKKIKKKTVKYQKYISSVIINQCQLESLEKIDESLNIILPDITFDVPSNFQKINLIQWLDLSNNKLSFIHKDLISLVNLKILNLNNNLFNDLNKVTNLGAMKNLINLTFIGNKIIKVPGYRQFLIEMCPILQQLDSAQVTEKELEVVHFGGSKFGEIRENGNGKVIRYPKIFK